MGFETLGLANPLLKVLERQGLVEPTPIQKTSIPLILRGGDLVGLAQTGTGKTAAFSLPVLTTLYGAERNGKFRPVRMLVLSPTRELAGQVEGVIKEFSSAVNLKSVPIFGGVPFFRQAQALRKGADILVATPGRLEDHVSQKTIDLSRVTHLILDEADQMLDIGFLPAIKRIFSLLPKNKQTLLFSATMPREIKNLSNDYLNNPDEVAVTPRAKPADKIVQQVLFLTSSEKLRALKDLVSNRQKKRILVFSRTKHGADKVVKTLVKAGLNVDAIHGNKSQNQRQRALENFKRGKCFVLIATDIAARGIDVRDVELVVNYDLPDVPETYIHRIGRTARAGASGQAISFCSVNERKNLKAIEKLIKMEIQNVSLDWKEIVRPSIVGDSELKKTGKSRSGRDKTTVESITGKNVGSKKNNNNKRNRGSRKKNLRKF
ncbi:MAG: DEAD/DEAH box helicase [Paracoccaceae bacterium]|nr:DEAD/DEAH box helicase [Paracoccaceae bacterium]